MVINANRKFIFSLMVLVAGCCQLRAQDSAHFSTYYFQRLTHFRTLPQTKGDVIFLGNSITDGAEWAELFSNQRIKNRGISGDVTAGILYRLQEVTDRRPAKVFLMIGVNDLAAGKAPDSVAQNIFLIAERIRQTTPATHLFVQSVLPVNDQPGKFLTHVNKTAQIIRVNELLRINAAQYGYTYVDLYTSFCDASGKLNLDYTNDGLHLKGEGYLLWQKLINQYVTDKPSSSSHMPKTRSSAGNRAQSTY